MDACQWLNRIANVELVTIFQSTENLQKSKKTKRLIMGASEILKLTWTIQIIAKI